MFLEEFARFHAIGLVEENRHRAANRTHSGDGYRRRRLRFWELSSLVIAVATLASTTAYGAPGDDATRWTGSWSAAPARVTTADGPQQYNDQTVRFIVHTTVGGQRVRVRISNLFGGEPLLIGAARIAVRDSGAHIIATTDRVLLFSNEPAIAVSPGALVLSDPVDLEIPALADVAVSLYFPNVSTAHTSHVVADLTSFIAKLNGNFTTAVDLPGASLTGEWDFLTGVDVSGDSSAAIVILGDSLTDGIGATPDTNRRWSDILAKRLQGSDDLKTLGVLNEALTGDRVRYPGPKGLEWFGPPALAQFDRDVLAQAGTRYLIVLMGTNDFAQPGVVAPTSEEASVGELIAGHLQLIRRAHEKGVTAYGCTLTPFKNSLISPGFYTPEKEAKREAFNEWIRTSGAYDAIIDFDKVLRDPAKPIQMLPAYDSGDHTHPNDAGNRAMANAVNIDLFRDDDHR